MKTLSKNNDKYVGDIGSSLKKLFCDLGFTTNNIIAEKTFIDPSTISNVFNNKRNKSNKIKRFEVSSIIKIVVKLSYESGYSVTEIWNYISDIYIYYGQEYSQKEINQINDLIHTISHCKNNSISYKIEHNLPPQDNDFIGRDIEKKQLIFDHLKKPKITTIDGIGGVGKTTLAIEVAYNIINNQGKLDYPVFDSIIYTSAKDKKLIDGKLYPISPNLQDNSLLDVLNIIGNVFNNESIKQTNDIKEKRTIVCDLLKIHKTLLIIDNLETINCSDLIVFLKDIENEKTSILITTRHRISFKSEIELNHLTKKEGLILINKLINRTRNNFNFKSHDLEALYQTTEGIPLKIIVAVGLLNSGIPLNDVITKIQEKQGLVPNFLFEDIINDLRNSTSREDVIAYKLLMASSFLEEPITLDAIKEIAGVNAELPSNISYAFNILQNNCLLRDKNFVSNENEYSMLSITLDYAHAELEKNQDFKEKATDRWIEYFTKMAKKYGKDYGGNKRGNWYKSFKILEHHLPNILAVSDFCSQYGYYEQFKELWLSLHSFTEVSGLWGYHYQYLGVLAHMADYYGDLITAIFAKSAIARVKIRAACENELKEAKKLLEEAVTLSLNRSLPSPIEIELFENKIMLYIELKEFEKAQECINKLKKMLNEVTLGEEDKIKYYTTIKYRQGQIFYLKSTKYTSQLDVRNYTDLINKAVELFREGLEGAEKIRWMRSIVAFKTRLAECYIDLKINYEESERLLRDSLNITKSNNYDRRSAYSLFALARLYQNNGNLTIANEKAKEALEIFNKFGMKYKALQVIDFLEVLEIQ